MSFLINPFVFAASPPEAITDLSAIAGYQSISLSWTAPEDNGFAITDYIIEESSDQSSWSVISDGTNTNTSYTRTGLSDNQTVYFRVVAVNENGQSEHSNIANATTPAPKATGGTISLVNGNWIHTFTTSGTFTPSESLSVSALVVAGGYSGGSGGPSSSGAGGSGGQVNSGISTISNSRTILVGGVGGGTSSISSWLSSAGIGVTGPAGRNTAGAGTNGSNGTSSSITGSSVVYGSSGGSGAFSTDRTLYNGGAAGVGAGNGGPVATNFFAFPFPGYAATNYGAGGGGAAGSTFRPNALPDGGAGKQGVVIISYAE